MKKQHENAKIHDTLFILWHLSPTCQETQPLHDIWVLSTVFSGTTKNQNTLHKVRSYDVHIQSCWFIHVSICVCLTFTAREKTKLKTHRAVKRILKCVTDKVTDTVIAKTPHYVWSQFVLCVFMLISKLKNLKSHALTPFHHSPSVLLFSDVMKFGATCSVTVYTCRKYSGIWRNHTKHAWCEHALRILQ